MRGHREITMTMTIAEEVPDEPPEEEEDISFEIITEEEIANLSCPFTTSMMSCSSSSSSISSQRSGSSLGSTGTTGPTTVIRAQNPRCQSTKGTAISTTTTTSAATLLTEEELTASARIWYLIQIKGHYHEDVHHQLETMENSSMKRTGWLFNLLHLHEKMKQSIAEKNRFNINSIPEETRQQLKHMYVY